MGVLHGRDLYNPKFINAEVDDAGGERHVVPIKYTIGDYFITEIKGQLYCFEIDYKLIKVRRGSGVKTIKYLNYDTTHFRPINPRVKELEQVLKKNSLPRVNTLLSDVFKVLSKREKQDNFEPHDLNKLIEELSKHEDKYGEALRNIVLYLKELDVKEIVTPLRSVSEFIEDDLKTTRPAFLGNLISLYQLADGEHKKITNSPITAKHDWAKMMLVVTAVALIAFIGYFGYTQGWFDSIAGPLSGIGDFQFGQTGPAATQPSTLEFGKKYPSVAAAKAALDRGEITMEDIPAAMRPLVQDQPAPSIEPKG